jgi:hypothetical protein
MTDEPEITYCAYCGENVIVGEACTCPHYWPEDEEATANEDCAMGMHSWLYEVGQLPPGTKCTHCGERYGNPS